MADPIQISIQFTGGNETPVEFPDEQMTITLELSEVGPSLFRIGSVPIMVEAASYGDIIEAELRTDGGLRFLRVAKAGGWRTYDFMLPLDLIESQHVTAIQNRVLSLGGHWERVFGGMLFLCLPPTTDYDPTKDVCNGKP